MTNSEQEQSLYLIELGEEAGERQQGMCCTETLGAGEGTGPSKTPLEEQLLGRGSRGRLGSCNPVQCIPLCWLEAIGKQGGTGKSFLESPRIAVGHCSPGHRLRWAGTPAVIRGDTLILGTLMFSVTGMLVPLALLGLWQGLESHSATGVVLKDSGGIAALGSEGDGNEFAG